MVDDRPEFELKLVESMESYPIPEAREGIVPADLVTSPEETLAALKGTKRVEAILERIPNIENLDLWFSTRQVSGAFSFLSLTVWKLP